MFATNMKILTLNTNNASHTAHGAGGKFSSGVNEFNNNNNSSCNNGSGVDSVANTTSGSHHKVNKRESKHCSKSKFVPSNMSCQMEQHRTQQQQQQQQQQQSQKYHKNNNSQLKNQHYNNSNNNNSTSSLNRKKYYHQHKHYQQQQQQQQKYFTPMIHSNNTTKSNTANNSENHNTNIMETCTCLLRQQSDKLSLLSSCSSGTSSSTTLSTATAATGCNSCSKHFTKVTQQTISSCLTNTSNNFEEFVVSAAAATEASKCNSNPNLTRATSSSTTASTRTLTATWGQLPLSSNTTSSFLVTKKKSFWKNSNAGGGCTVIGKEGGEGKACLTSSGYSTDSTTQSPKISKEKQQHVTEKKFITNASKNLGKNTNSNGNVQKYSTKLAVNINTSQKQNSKDQFQVVEKITMTTSLAASSGSTTSINSSVSSNNNSIVSPVSKILATSRKQQQDTLETPIESKQMLITFSSNSDSNNNNNNINKIITSTSSSTSTSSVPSSQNSYTLDFLHSVGVKMTDAALRTSRIPESRNTYDNHIPNKLPVHGNYPYTNQRHPRYMYGGSNVNNGSNKNQQHQYYHHHQPSQLTIASFLHKDLLGEDNNVQSTVNSTSGGIPTSSNSRNTNYCNDQQQQQQQQHFAQQQQPSHTRYHQNYYASPYQQQSAVMQHANYGGRERYGESGRLGTNGGNGGGQRISGYTYTNYHNASGESGTCKNSNLPQLNGRQLQNNIGNSKNTQNNSQANKKLAYASSTTSTCSSSSSNSIQSNSLHIPSRQLQTVATRESKNNTSNLNLAIETLPAKTISGSNQRGNHRGHQNHYGHYYRGNHHNQHSMTNPTNVLQHQNYYNLTYVTTDSSVNCDAASACSPSPQLLTPTQFSATNCHSPKPLDNNLSQVAILMNFNTNHLQYPRYSHTQQQLAVQQQQQFHQFQQHQQNLLNKKMILPLTLNMPSPSSSPAPPQRNNASISLNSQQAPPPPEASATAATAPATYSSSSGVISGYESDTSSNHSATQIKYQSLNSIKSSVSPSSSCSSVSVSAALQTTQQQMLQQNCGQPTTSSTCDSASLLHSPFDYNYSGAAAHTFSNLQMAQQPHLPQFCRHNNGAVISVLNLPTKSPNSFAGDDCQQQQNQFYFNTITNQKSADLLNIAPALTVTNRCNNNSGYWTPSYHNNHFVYHPTPSTQVPPMPPTTSSSPSVSPRLPSDDRQQQIQERLRHRCSIGSSSSSPTHSTSSLNLNNIIVGNTTNANSEVLLVGSPYSSNSSVSDCSNNESSVNVNSAYEDKSHLRGPLKLLAQHQQQLMAQQLYQYPPSSTSSTVPPSVVSKGEIGINVNNEHNIQLPSLPQTSMTASVNSSCISGVQPFVFPPPLPPHNLLYNNPQTHHMRALSSSSAYDFTTHTPPDRFLARAHLIEAKEAPATLLNNSKWDHLSRSIWQKFITSQQTEETFKQKMHLWRNLYLFIKNAYPRYGLYLVGSTISGFGSDSSDVDMCLVSRGLSSIDPRTEALYNLTVLRDCLSKSGEFENFNLIEAKVPILRFSDRMHQLEVDLNFNNCVGIKNTHLLYCYSQLDWRLRPLVLITKLWAQYHNINNAKNMTISSYSLVLMVIHFLQYAVSPPVLPCLHEILPDKFTLLRSNDFGYVDLNETIGPYDSKNCQTIGELFLLFLEYYSCFDYTQFAISVRTGGLLPISLCRAAKSIKNDIHQWKELCIEEPFDLTNTARSVYNYETFERIKAVFVASWRILQETLDLNSVFSCSPDIGAIQNINSTITATAFSEIETNVHVTDTKINFEQHEKEFRLSSSSCENKKSFNEYFNEAGDMIIKADDIADEDDDSSATVTNRGLSKRKDLNRTLTPCQINGFDEKEFPLSLSSASSLTCIKTNTKNVNRSINNKTSTFIIS